MTQIISIGRALPERRYSQSELMHFFERMWMGKHHNPRRLRQLHAAVQVGSRHMALPLDAYEHLTFEKANDAWIEVGLEVGARAILAACERAGVGVRDIDAVYFTTVTGISTPSLDALLINRLGMRSDIRRTPMFGLGCVAGAAGISRVNEFLLGKPDGLALLLSVELCSLTLQSSDLSIANMIGTGLFGDGAAAVIVAGHERAATLHVGAERAGPKVVDSRSCFYPNTEGVMGWDIGNRGFRLVLSAEVPDIVRQNLRGDVDTFLAEHDLRRSDIECWVCHPGGPKVLRAFEVALEVDRSALQVTWDSLAEVGNLSSSSILFVMDDTMRAHRPRPGALGMMLAMGPGFCSELVLQRW